MLVRYSKRMCPAIMSVSSCCSWEVPRLFRICKDETNCIHVLVTLFFYVLSFMLTTVIENQFYLDKACVANFGYNQTICKTMIEGNYTIDEVNIQKYVATFTIYNNLVRQVLPIIPGVLMGMWSDKYGGRGPIIIGMVGKTVYFLGYVLNAIYFVEWPLERVLFTAALPRALAGYDVGIFMASRSYISEATPPEKITQRLATFEMTYQISAPIGLTLGSIIFTASGRNYVTSFLVSMAVAAFGLIYAIVLIKNISREKCSQLINEDTPIMKAIGDIFNAQYVQSNRIIFVLLCLIFLQSMMYDSPLQFLYTQFKFRWDTDKFSNFQTTEAICSIIVSAILVPLTAKLQMSDVTVMTGGIIMVLISRLCYGITNDEKILYLGAFASSFQIFTYIIIYSMACKNASLQNRGKLLAVFTSIESATSLISSPIYSTIYSETILRNPAAIFFLSSALQLIMLLLVILLRCIS